jgi:hypothetical protein
LKITRGYYKNRGIALYVISLLLLSVLVFSLNNASISTVAYGTNANDGNNGNNNELNNRLLISEISGRIAGSSIDTDKEQVQQVLRQIHTQIATTAGEDEATNAIKQISSIIHLNPDGALAQSLSLLAKQRATGNIDTVKQAAMKVAESKTSFNAPSNLQADTTMTFKLTVANPVGVSDIDTVSVLVKHGANTKGTLYQSGYDHGCSDAKLPPSKIHKSTRQRSRIA